LPEPTEVIRFGEVVGFWIPVAPIVKPRPAPLEAGDYTGQRRPLRGTAAARRLAPYFDALDEAEENARVLQKQAREHRQEP
jgi:hypothetical protein